jgi:hypothetical protein
MALRAAICGLRGLDESTGVVSWPVAQQALALLISQKTSERRNITVTAAPFRSGAAALRVSVAPSLGSAEPMKFKWLCRCEVGDYARSDHKETARHGFFFPQPFTEQRSGRTVRVHKKNHLLLTG